MIKSGPGVVRIELLWHRIAPVYRSWTTDKISNAAAAHPHSISTWPSTPWVGRNEDVDTRIKSAQDEFQLLVILASKFFSDSPAAGSEERVGVLRDGSRREAAFRNAVLVGLQA